MAFRASSTRRSTASSAVSATATVFNNSSGGGFTISGSTVTANTAVSIGVVTSGQSSASGTTSIPIITGYTVTDGSYNNFDDTAVNTSGGYIKVNGSGFASGTIVYINGSVVSSTYVSSTQMRAVVPALAAGSYSLMVFTGTAGAIYSSLVTSGFPSWTSSSYTSTTLAVSVQLLATGDGTLTYSLYSGTLPSGLTLDSNGLISGTVTGDSVTSDLVFLVNDGQLQTTQQTVSLTISTTDTYWKNTTAILQGDVVPFISDASTNAFTVTPVGDTRPYNFNPYTPGYYSNYFDGTGDYLSSTYTSVGSSDFCFEAWIYVSSLSANRYIFSQTNSAIPNNASIGFAVLATSASKVAFLWCVSTSQTSVTSTNSLITNQWNHVAAVRSGSTFTVYLNGTGTSTTSSGTINVLSSSPQNYIGYFITEANSTAFIGYISNLRLVIGNPVYTGAFTPPTNPLASTQSSGTNIAAITGTSTSLLTCQSNRLIDNSTNAFTITKNGDVSVKPNHPFTPNSSYAAYGSAYFDGTGDYLTVADNAALEIGSSDFTIEAWIYPISNASSTYYTWIFKGPDNSFGTFYFPQYNGVIKMFFDDNGSSPWLYHGINSSYNAGTLTINAWNHLAITRSGTSIRGFVNGVLGSTITVSAGQSFFNSSSGLSLGAQTAGSEPSNGYMADFRFIIGSAVYTSAFTPPTTPLTAISGTSLLTLQTNLPHNNNTVLDNSTNNFAVTRSGSPVQGTFSPYSGYYSNYFDGTGDYIETQNLVALTPASNFTIECWVYNLGFSGSQYGRGIFSLLDTTNTDRILIRLNSSSDVINLYGATSAAARFGTNGTDSSIQVVPMTWTHVALVRQSSSFVVYLNGVSVITATSAADFGNIRRVRIGGNTDGTVPEFNGYISNFRFVNGSAVYTGAFTPPTTLLATSQSSGTNIAALTTIGSVNNKSVYFDGTGDYLDVTSSSITLSSNWTVECWFNTSVVTGGGVIIFDFRPDGTNGYYPELSCTNNGTQLSFYYNAIDYAITVGTYLNQWNHVAIVKNSGTLSVYFNGASVYSVSDSNTWSLGTNRPRIGANGGYFGAAPAYYTGYISNFRIVNGTAVYTGAFTPPTTPLTAISGTRLLTCQSPTIIDNSTNAYTITANGNAAVNYTTSPFSIDAVKLLTCQSNRLIDNSTNAFTITKNGDTSVKPFSPFGRTSEYSIASNGGSVYFDGASYLNVPYNANLLLNSVNSTIEAWFYLNAAPGAVGSSIPFFIQGTTAATPSVSSNGANFWCFADATYLYFGGYGAATYIQVSISTIPIKQWFHLAISITSGTSATIYINGVSAVSGSISAIGNSSSFGTQLGLVWTGGGSGTANYLNGYISNLRIIRGTALYTTTFTPPTAPVAAIQNTGLLIDGTSGAVIDGTTNGNILTSADARVLNTQYKYGNTTTLTSGSLYFDGTGDYMTMPYVTSLYDWWQGDFTIEAWVYPVSLATWQYLTSSTMIGNNDQGGTTNYWSFGPLADGTVRFYYWNGNPQSKSSTATVTTGTWSHIAMSKTSSGITIFVNGTASTTTAVSGTPQSSTGYPLTIGRGNSVSINGYIDDLRITRGYARYVANFTVPAVAFKTR